MEYTIRPARGTDCPRLLELIRELAEYERAPQEVTVTLEHFQQSGFGPQPVWWAIVAEDVNGLVIGFALYYIRYSTWKGQRMYLEDILVTESWRGKGVGQVLLDALRDEAKRKKLNAIVWQVLDWNEPALRFYRRQAGVAFDAEWINVSVPIDLTS
jgi:GNAT superfamily N-acetyltransferase